MVKYRSHERGEARGEILRVYFQIEAPGVDLRLRANPWNTTALIAQKSFGSICRYEMCTVDGHRIHPCTRYIGHPMTGS